MKTTEQRYSEIGQRIRDARERLGVSQRELAEKIHFESPTAISLIEAGKRAISIVQLEKVADALNVTLEYLLGNEEKELDLRVALRAQRKLSDQDQKTILEFVEFMKNKHGRS